MTKEEWFDLPKLKMFDKDFNEKQFDEEMALGLLNELQVNWCGRHCDNYRKNSCGCYFPKFKEQMILKIKDRFESKENTLEFKNFRLHADSTLKCMSKDELINYIHMLHHNWSVSDEQLFNVIEKNNTLQNEVDYYKHEYYSMCDLYENPQPYKFEELKKGMWIWDDENEMFILITFIDKQFKKMHVCLTEYDGFNDEYVNVEYTEYFEEGRFYPPTKALEYQK